ncbi:MAG: Ig-like domain-containing protein, partial [Acidobacteria bacterium]|nr:Ig-like domain-containing protein [Acidobacteriota bacterium]
RTASAARSVMVRSSGPRIVITEPLTGFATNRKKVDIAGAVVGGKATIPGETLSLIPQQGNSRTVTLDATGAFRALDVPLVSGTNTVTVTGTDAHNRTGSTTVLITSDQTTPGIAIKESEQPVPEGKVFGKAVTLRVEVTDDSPSFPAPEIRLNGAVRTATGASTDVTVTQAGGYVLSVAAKDAAGNETRVERSFVIDLSPCTLSEIEPRAGVTTTETSVTLHGKSGSAQAVKVRTASGTTYTAQLADGTFAIAGVPLETIGENTLTLVCVDRSGQERPQARTITRIGQGPGPVITLTSPQNNAKQTGGTVTVSGMVSDPSASVRVNGTIVAVNPSTGAFSTSLAIAEGPNVVFAEAVDAAKRRSTERRVVERDSQAPGVRITSPLANQRIGATSVTVTGQVEIESEPNLASVTVETPVGTVTATVNPDTGAFTAEALLSGTAGANTAQLVKARTVDSLGQAATVEVSVYVDPQGPALEVTQPPDLTWYAATQTQPVTVSGTATGKEGARITVNGTQIDPATLIWGAPDANGRRSSPFTASVPLPSAVSTVLVPSPASAAMRGRAGEGAPGSPSPSSADSTSPSVFTIVARVEDLDGAFANERRLLFLDVFGPTVLEMVPADGTTQADANTIPLVLFSEPVKKSTLTAGLTPTRTGTSDPIAGTYVMARNAVAFVPGVALTPGQQYRFSAKNTLQDFAGNSLTQPKEVTFTVASDVLATAPQLDAIPAVICAQTLQIKGTTAPGARIRVVDGSLSSTGNAGADGRFAIEIPVSGNGFHEIRVHTLTAQGDAGPEARVLVRIDCGAPSVTSASFDRVTGTITVTFSEPMNAATLTVGGPTDALRLSDAEDGTRTAQTATVMLDSQRTTASLQLSTAQNAWWRTKPVRLEVRPPASDSLGNAIAAAYETVFYIGGGPGDLTGSFLAGEVYDEASGRPLSGASARLFASGANLPGSVAASNQTAPVSTQTTDGRGRYAMAGDVTAGRYAVVLEKSGYTRAIRRMALEPSTGFVPFDARLTPLSASSTLTIASGGTLNGPSGSLITLEVSPNGITAPAQTVGVQITPLSGQGLPELLPLGWSPIVAAHIGIEANGEALGEGQATPFAQGGVQLTLPLPAGTPAGAALLAVRHDITSGTWITLGTLTRTTGADGIDRVRFDLVGPGSVVVVTPDEDALIRPPIPTQPATVLQGSTLPNPLPTLTGTLTLDPPQVAPTGKSRARVEAHSTDNSPWPSGLAVQAYLDEKLILSDGSELYESPFSTDLVLYHSASSVPSPRVSGERVPEGGVRGLLPGSGSSGDPLSNRTGPGGPSPGLPATLSPSPRGEGGTLTRRSAPPSPARAGEGLNAPLPITVGTGAATFASPLPRGAGEGGRRPGEGLLGPGIETPSLRQALTPPSPFFAKEGEKTLLSSSSSGVLEFIVSPSPKAAEVILQTGYDNIRLYPYTAPLERGSVLGPSGGTVTSTDGIELTLPEGTLAGQTVLTARYLTAAELQGLTPPLGFQVLTGVRIESAGQSFARAATLVMKTPSGTPPDPQGEPRIVLAKWDGQPADGRGAFANVINRGERIAASGSNPEKLRFAPEPGTSTLPLTGITGEGVYLILRAEAAIGYATGFVKAESGIGYADARATAAGLGTADLSRPGGRYAIPVPAGTNKVVSAKHPVLDETGTVTILSLAPNAVIQQDITIRPQGPTILSVQPLPDTQNQPIGTAITMQFSEALDPVSIHSSQFRAEIANTDGTSTGVQVLGTLAPGSANTQLVFTPARPLPTGVRILCSFLGGVRDAGGTLYAGAVPYTWSFTTSTVYPWGGQINPAKIRILVPVNGTSQIVGDAGALPTTQGTPWSVSPDLDGVVCSSGQTVPANSQGGFGPVVAGCPANPLTLSSIVWLKVFDPTGTLAATIKLGPFTTPDGKGFVARAGEETTYTTTEGIEVTVPAEAFGEAKLVTVKTLDPSGLNLTPPAGMEVTSYVDVDFEGRAGKTLLLKIPAQTTAPAGRLWFAGELVGTPWGERLNLIDVGTVVETAGQKYLSNHDSDLPTVQQTRQRPAPLANENPIRRTLDEIKLARKAVILASKGLDYAVATGGISLDLVKPQELLYNAVADLFVYLDPGFDWDGEWVLPVAPGTVFTIVRRSLATGWIVAQRDFSALSAGGRIVRIEGQSDFPGQLHGPRAYVDLSPFSFSRYTVENVLGTSPSCAGLRPELNVCSSPGKVAAEAAGTPLAAESRVLLFNPKTKASLERTANAGGGFERLELPADPGQEVWVVVTPGDLDPDRFEEFRVDFDRPLPKLSPSGVPFSAPEVARLSDCGPIGQSGCANTAIPAEFVLTENLAGLRIRPLQSLPRGHQFKLKLETSMFGDAEDLPAVFSFATRKAQGQAAVGVTPGLGDTTTARDIMKFGNLLLAGSATGNIVAMDISNPEAPREAGRLSTPANDVRAFATDGHGRLFYSAEYGGTWGVKTIDVAEVRRSLKCVSEPCASRPFPATLGSVRIAHSLSGIVTAPEYLLLQGSLPSGSPVVMDVIVDDDITEELELAEFYLANASTDAGSLESRLTEEGRYVFPVKLDFTVNGRRVASSRAFDEQGKPLDDLCPAEGPYYRYLRATVDNLATGESWSFDVDNPWPLTQQSGILAKAEGITARRGDKLRIRYNRRTFGYVGITGSGITVVDLNRSYRTPYAPQPEQATGPWQLRAQCGRRLGSYEGQDRIPTMFATAGVAAQPPVGHKGANQIHVYSVLKGHGLIHTTSSWSEPGNLTFAGQQTLNFPGTFLRDVVLAPGVPVLVGSRTEELDLLFTSLGAGGIEVHDVTNRAFLKIGRFFRAKHHVYRLQVDVARGRLYAGGCEDGDCAKPFIDVWSIGKPHGESGESDPRLLYSVPMGWETNHLGLDPSGMGLIFTWSNNLTAVPGPSGVVVPVEDPRFAFFGTYRADAGVKVEPTLRFLPLGAAAHIYAPDDQDPAKKAAAEKLYTPAVRLRIALPGSLGERLGVRLQSLRSAPEPRLWNRPDSELKKHIALPGGPGWPETSTFVTLKRLSSDKFVEGYNLYESEEHVLLLADPRAKAGYVRRDLPNELADEAGQCRRCDKPAYLGSAPVKEMLVSGPYLRAHLAVHPSQTPAVQQATQAALDLFNRMGENYRAPSGMAEAAMWADSVGSPVQTALAEPVLGRAVAGFEAGASVSLLDGESLLEQTDHSVKARAVGFSFSRGYRSGVLGFGPLGSLGWSGSLFAHLRPNPVTGAVEYITGTGDVLTFLPMKGYPYSCPAQTVADARTEPEVDQNGSYCVPKGFYGRLLKMSGDAGWQLITRQHDILYFDASGRLKAIADRHRQDKPIGEQGSTLQLAHDVHGDLIQARDDMGRTYRFRYEEDPASPRYGLLKEIEDHWGRTVRYAFDESRRLLSVTLPKVTKTTLTGSYPSPAISYRNVAGPNGRSLLAGYTLPGSSAERVTFQYATDGRVTSVSVPASTGTGPGPSWTLQYDGAALTTKATVTQPWGHRVESVLDVNGRTMERRELGVPTLDVFGATPPPGGSLTSLDLVTRYTYLADGRVETELRPDTGRTMYSYETSLHDRLGRLNVSEERHGAETPVVDTRRRGPVTYSETASQAKYQGDNIPYQFTDGLGRKGTAAVPQAASPAVPGSGRNIQEKLEPEGDQPAIVTTQDFDGYGRPVYQKDGPSMSGAPEKWFTYGKDELGKEGAGFLTEVKTQRGALTLTERFERDEHGNVTSRAASYGVSATAEYDEWDRVIRGVSGKGTGTYPGVDATTELGYDETGHLIRERRKQTGVTGGWVETTYQYNSREQLISQTTTPVAGAALSGDATASATTAFEYDAFGRLWKVRSPAGIETVYTYDSAGRIATETRGVSGPSRRGYDPLHRMVFLTDGDQGVWRGYHDIWGRRYRDDLPAGGVREREHDAAHGLIRETLWSGDPGSPGVERLSEIRTRERITGDIDQTRELLTNLPETWRVTKKKLDSAGRVIRVSSGPTDAIQRVEKEMAYDSGNRVTLEQDAVGNETAYVYPNESPWPTEIRRRETNPAEPPVLTVTSTLTHDALGRVTREVRSDGRTVETTLDEAGNVRVLDEGNGKRTVTSYDGTGKVTRTEKAGTESKTYGYDLDGRILGRRVATAGGTHAETRYQYDGSGRLMVVTRPPNSICSPCRESYTYNPDDTLDRETLRSGIQVGHAYDSANRLMNRRIVQAGSTGVQPLSDLGDDYTYDRASRVLSSMRPQTGAPPVRYPVYDTGGRPLQEVVGTRTPVGKGYDTWSRQTSVTLPHGETYSRVFDDLDRLTEIGTSAGGQAGATWVWGGASRIYGITSKGPLHAAHRYGYIGGLGAQVPSGTGTPATKWKLGTLTVGAQTGTEPVTGPPAAAWGTFGYGYTGESGNKLGREVMESAGPSVLANQGWAWGTDTKFRLTAAASGKGSMRGLSESTAGIERFSYAYGASDELLSAGRGVERADYQTGAEGNVRQVNGVAVLYDADGRRIEDDRFRLIWNWRGELDHVIAKDAWPGKDPSDARVPAGHKVVYARDAVGRLYSRTHLGKPATTGDESSRPFIDKQEFVWDGQTLMAIEGRAFDGGLTYRMSLVPGATGLDDAVQLRVQRFDVSGTPQPEKLYTYLKDELGTNLGLVEERTGADPTKPPLVVRYHYTPYGEVRAETGPEVLRAFFDNSLASVTRFDGTTAAQTVNPAQAVAGGFLLEFTLAPDATTLGAGLIVERRLTDGTWGALQASELAFGRRSNAEAGEVIILPLSGWTKDSTYRIRLTQTLKDGFGRSIANAPNLEIPIPADGAAPVFEKRWPFDYESIFAASETANGAFPWAQPFLFHGAFQDPVTGLINLRARWYDPRTAQFLSEDPLDDIDSPNVYGYVAGRPHEARDP